MSWVWNRRIARCNGRRYEQNEYIYTVRQTTQGVANEIIESGKESKGVVIAFDSQNSSKRFAYECARVLCANGIKTYLFDDLRPTPEFSFSVRYLSCARGIVKAVCGKLHTALYYNIIFFQLRCEWFYIKVKTFVIRMEV